MYGLQNLASTLGGGVIPNLQEMLNRIGQKYPVCSYKGLPSRGPRGGIKRVHNIIFYFQLSILLPYIYYNYNYNYYEYESDN